jgi:hypothetical protein
MSHRLLYSSYISGVKENGAKAPFAGCLFYKVSPTPELQFLRLLVQNARRLRRRVFRSTRMYLLLHLLILLDLESSPTQLPSSISNPVETMAGPL